MTVSKLIATWFGSGLSPLIPGTVGTAAGLPVGFVIWWFLGMPGLIAATAIAFFGGWWATHCYMQQSGRLDDPREVVIDEVAGIWFTLSIMPLMYLEPTIETVIGLHIAAFFAFRLFDIWKPWPVSLADRKLKGAFGVMLDDMLAAVYAALLLGALGHALAAIGWLSVPIQHG